MIIIGLIIQFVGLFGGSILAAIGFTCPSTIAGWAYIFHVIQGIGIGIFLTCIFYDYKRIKL